jgi:hypothetical protein
VVVPAGLRGRYIWHRRYDLLGTLEAKEKQMIIIIIIHPTNFAISSSDHTWSDTPSAIAKWLAQPAPNASPNLSKAQVALKYLEALQRHEAKKKAEQR